MKDFFSKNKNKIFNLLPIMLFTLYILFIHCKMLGKFGDDIWFSNFKNQSLLGIMKNRYMNWTSRFILDTFLFIFNSYTPKLWILIDIVLCYLIYYSLNKIINPENKTEYKLLIVLLFMLYPFTDMGSAGWITTTIVYLWPLALLLYSFSVVVDILREKNIKPIYIILSVISLIVAINQEQTCLLSFGFLFIFMIYQYLKNKKINKILVIYIILTILMLGNHLLCPGNGVRVDISVASSFPDYNNLSLFGKIGLSLNNTYEMLLGQINYIFILLFVILIINMIKTKQNKLLILINIVLLCLCIVIPHYNIFNMSKSYNNYLCPSMKNCLDVLPIIRYGSKRYIISIAISIVYTIDIMYTLYKIFIKDKSMKIFIPIMFLAGILSRLVVGFSPTLYISGYRTGIFMYFLFILVILLIIKNQKNNKYYEYYGLITVFIILTHFIELTLSFKL